LTSAEVMLVFFDFFMVSFLFSCRLGEVHSPFLIYII